MQCVLCSLKQSKMKRSSFKETKTSAATDFDEPFIIPLLDTMACVCLTHLSYPTGATAVSITCDDSPQMGLGTWLLSMRLAMQRDNSSWNHRKHILILDNYCSTMSKVTLCARITQSPGGHQGAHSEYRSLNFI